MSKIEKIGARLLRGIVAMLLISVVAIEGASAQSTERSRRDFELGKSTEILANIMREFEMGHVDNIKASDLLNSATQGMIAATDPYSEYIPEESMADFEMLTTGRYAGVGSLIRKKGDYVLFAQPYKNSPSDEAGVRLATRFSLSTARI